MFLLNYYGKSNLKTLLLILSTVILLSCSNDDKSTTEPTVQGNLYCSDVDIMPDGLEDTYVRIVGVLPNPDGDDDYNEQFRVKSFLLDSNVDIGSYYILDDEDVRWDLDELESSIDYIETDNCRTITYTSDKVAQLLNSGDVIYLYNKDEVLIQTVSFGAVGSGEWVDFFYNYSVIPGA